MNERNQKIVHEALKGTSWIGEIRPDNTSRFDVALELFTDERVRSSVERENNKTFLSYFKNKTTVLDVPVSEDKKRLFRLIVFPESKDHKAVIYAELDDLPTIVRRCSLTVAIAEIQEKLISEYEAAMNEIKQNMKTLQRIVEENKHSLIRLYADRLEKEKE